MRHATATLYKSCRDIAEARTQLQPFQDRISAVQTLLVNFIASNNLLLNNGEYIRWMGSEQLILLRENEFYIDMKINITFASKSRLGWVDLQGQHIEHQSLCSVVIRGIINFNFFFFTLPSDPEQCLLVVIYNIVCKMLVAFNMTAVINSMLLSISEFWNQSKHKLHRGV